MSALIHRTLPQSDGPTPDQIAARKAAMSPLLSDDVMFSDISPANKYAHGVVCSWVRDWYEAKIASGELMVVKTVKRSELNDHIRTVHDISWDAAGSKWTTHCAGCGAKIIEG